MIRLISAIIIFFSAVFVTGPTSLASVEPAALYAGPDPSVTETVTDSLLFGVVWAPPDHTDRALHQLHRIHGSGATAIRLTALPPNDTVLARADTLGLRLFVDLPVSHVPAYGLPDALRSAEPVLNTVLTKAHRFQSIQAIGLARYTDTTVPAACNALHEWNEHVKDHDRSLDTYYVTPFHHSSDACDDAVDVPMFAPRGVSHPVDRWLEWQEETSSVHLGELGTWTTPSAPEGLRSAHSPERQARYLERALARLQDSLPRPPSATFVYRWKDEASPVLSGRRYGVHDQKGAARPAATVLEGMYRGTQRVFAFPSGRTPSQAPNGAIILSWALLFVLGAFYSQHPFVRRTAHRYFSAHGFYRDAVGRGREIVPPVNLALLITVSLALGTIGSLCTQLAAEQSVTELLVAALPSTLQATITTSLAQPFLTGAVIAGSTLVLTIVWISLLFLAARISGRFSFAQGVMLVVWPSWPTLVGLIVALVMATKPPLSMQVLGLLLLLGGLLTSIAITIRVLHDYKVVSGLPTPLVAVLALPSPVSVLLLSGLYLTIHYNLPISYLWHLVTRT